MCLFGANNNENRFIRGRKSTEISPATPRCTVILPTFEDQTEFFVKMICLGKAPHANI